MDDTKDASSLMLWRRLNTSRHSFLIALNASDRFVIGKCRSPMMRLGVREQTRDYVSTESGKESLLTSMQLRGHSRKRPNCNFMMEDHNFFQFRCRWSYISGSIRPC